MSRASPVEEGYTVSPSQVGNALRCLRVWAWDKLDGVRAPPGRQQKLGLRVHAILEDWLRDATPPDHEERMVLDGKVHYPGRIAFNGLHMLPPPGPHMRLEFLIRFSHWLGYIDWAFVGDGAIGELGIPYYGDHKTSGDPAKHGLDEESIKTDIQALVYANAIFAVFKDVPYVRGRWDYFGTRGRFPTKAVDVVFTREQAKAGLEPYDRLAEGLIKLRVLSTTSGLRAIDLPPSPSACGDYGGCFYVDRCNLSAEQRMESYMDHNESDLEAKMALALNGTATLLSPPPAIAPQWPPDGWLAHTTPGWYWNPGLVSLGAVSEADLRARYAPPVVAPVAQPPAIVMPAIPTLPVVVQPVLDLSMVAPALPVVQVPSQAPVNGVPVLPPIVALPVGMINAPESVGVPQRVELLPEIVEAPGAAGAAGSVAGVQDDLTAVDDRDVLVKVALAMGLDVKGIRVPGIKDKIRAARLTGAPVIAATPPVPKQPSLPNTNHVGTSSHGVVEPGHADDSTRPLEASAARKDRATQIACAFIAARDPFESDLELVRRAFSIADLFDRG